MITILITIFDLLFIGFIIILCEAWILSIKNKRKIEKEFKENQKLEDERNGR